MLGLELTAAPNPSTTPPSLPTYSPPLYPSKTKSKALAEREPTLYMLFAWEVNTLNLTFLTNRDFFLLPFSYQIWDFLVIVWLAGVSYS